MMFTQNDVYSFANALLNTLNENKNFLGAIIRKDKEIKQLQEALDASHFYIDASDQELKDRNMTRDDALYQARVLREALKESERF